MPKSTGAVPEIDCKKAEKRGDACDWQVASSPEWEGDLGVILLLDTMMVGLLALFLWEQCHWATLEMSPATNEPPSVTNILWLRSHLEELRGIHVTNKLKFLVPVKTSNLITTW